MPYVVNKAFRACGKMLCQGEIIDAGKWKTKNSLLSLGWISYVKPAETTNLDNRADRNINMKTAAVTEQTKPLKKAKAEPCIIKGDDNDNNDI